MLSPTDAIPDAPEDVRADKQEESADCKGDQNHVEQVDKVHKWVVFERWLEMTRPSIRKVRIGVGVALLARDQQILFDNLRPLVLGRLDIMVASAWHLPHISGELRRNCAVVGSAMLCTP
jgi:hypothetical protein